MSRVLGSGLLAVLLLASDAATARADLPPPGPWPWSRGRKPKPPHDIEPAPPQPMKVLPDGSTVPDQFPPNMKPARSGPFRSCGSGLGTGLAGIGVAWGLMWLGTRAAGRIRVPKVSR